MDNEIKIINKKKKKPVHTGYLRSRGYFPTEFYPEVKFDIIEFPFGISDISPSNVGQ